MFLYKTIFIVVIALLSAPVTQAELPKGDAINGERVFWACRTCHYVEKIVGHNNGPNLWNILGQRAGKQPGFEYSEAFSNVEFAWTPELMDIWLQDPSKFVPGNMMMSPGVKDAQDRADVIEYMKTFSGE